MPTPRVQPPPSRVRRPRKRRNPVARAFLRGLLIVVPTAATLWIVVTAFLWIDGLIRLELIFGRDIPGLGFVLALAGIAVLGFVGGNVLARYFLEAIEGLFTHTPLVRLIYTSLRDLIDAFVGERERFDAPVLVAPFGPDSALVPGFVTRKDLAVFGLRDHVAVYLPQAYNFAGQLLAVPRERVLPIEADSAEVMTFIVSGGLSGAGAQASA